MKSRFAAITGPCLACLVLCSIVNVSYFPTATILPDEQRFLQSAARLAASGEFWVGNDRAWEMPGTALFFAPTVWLFGEKAAVLPIRFLQSALLAAQCVFVACIAQSLFRDRRAALIAACIVSIYPFLLFYQGLLLSETLFDTLLLAALAALLHWRERGLRLDFTFALASLLFVAATLTKATLTVAPPLLFAAAAWFAGASGRRTLTILVAATGLYCALMSPWWIRNAEFLHAFVPFTTGSAQNLYLGNNPYNKDAGIDWGSDVDLALAAKLRAIPNELDRQQAFSQVAIDYIEKNPGTFVLNAAKKFIRFWNLIPNATEFRSRLYLFVSAASFSPILTLAVICIVRRRHEWRLLTPIYFVVVYFTLLHVVTIASLRYRLPLEPLLIVLASEPLAAVAAKFRASGEQST